MNETITIFDGLVISGISLVIVFGLLYLLSLLLQLFKVLFYKETPMPEAAPVVPGNEDEEERLVVAITATIIAGKDKPDGRFHISKIKRLK